MVTRYEDGFNSRIRRATIGTDYQFTDQVIAGLAANFHDHDGHFQGGGHFNSKFYGALAFGSFLPSPEVFVQLSTGYGRKTYDRIRTATFIQREPPPSGSVTVSTEGQVHADFNASEATADILAGYDYRIGNITVSPFAGVDWKRTKIDTYSEAGSTGLELTFQGYEQASLQAGVGIQALATLESGSWDILPHVNIKWKHEFENDQRSVVVSFLGDTRSRQFSYQTEAPDRDWGEISLGITAVSPLGLQMFATYRTLLGNAHFDGHSIAIGVRVPF